MDARECQSAFPVAAAIRESREEKKTTSDAHGALFVEVESSGGEVASAQQGDDGVQRGGPDVEGEIGRAHV